MKLKKPKFWINPKISFLAIFLYPLSLLIQLFSYFSKIKSPKKFQIPIICVGNIYLGGTGKTPLAMEIYKITKLLGKNPAFVKKKYDYLKDEINMLKKSGEVFVNKKRMKAIELLIKEKNDLAILDDGFQDFTIEKKFSILCFNQKQWIGNGLIIPSGPLREKFSALNRAQCVVINGKKDTEIEEKIYKVNSKMQIYYSNFKLININKFKDKKIVAFAGIGNPSNFFDLLKENNLNVLNKISFPDHYQFSKNDLDKLILESNNQNAILVTTEKDYCRINESYKNNIECAEVELEINNKDKFIELLKKNI
tara:strand:- start:399 stop:1325 length:927 start_codon:yes stop_codon:yes gene_type:complete